MDAEKTIKAAWLESLDQLNKTYWFQRILSRDFRKCHYMGALQETYHHAGLNPQIQAYCTMFLDRERRTTIELFYTHAKSEIGHDLLALNDVVELGADKTKIIASRPLPTTLAFNAFTLMQIQFGNPISYLGYLYHLEHLLTEFGKHYIESFKAAGIPKEAMEFVFEHATVDVGHNNLMSKYITDLVKTNKDLDDVIYSTQSSCELHGLLMSRGFENGEKLYGSIA